MAATTSMSHAFSFVDIEFPDSAMMVSECPPATRQPMGTVVLSFALFSFYEELRPVALEFSSERVKAPARRSLVSGFWDLKISDIAVMIGSGSLGGAIASEASHVILGESPGAMLSILVVSLGLIGGRLLTLRASDVDHG